MADNHRVVLVGTRSAALPGRDIPALQGAGLLGRPADGMRGFRALWGAHHRRGHASAEMNAGACVRRIELLVVTAVVAGLVLHRLQATIRAVRAT